MPEPDAVGGITAQQLNTAAIRNGHLRIEMHVHRADPDKGTVFLTADVPGVENGLVLLSMPDLLWATLGRRLDIVARLSIEEDDDA